MSAAQQREASQRMAADLIRRGYPHGRRQSKGLSNIPDLQDHGSAAYRRLQAKRKQKFGTRRD